MDSPAMEDVSESTNSTVEVCNPYDMNTTDFNADLYMNKVLKESRLSELMDTEQMLYKQIQTLDSEMQTLIYENYNKFISATETVRKMSSHFDKMEHELTLLARNMESITDKSTLITTAISGRREELSRMSTTHQMLDKIQFLLELPEKMAGFLKEGSHVEAAKVYLGARHALDQYGHFSSIKNIQAECNELLDKVKDKLYNQMCLEQQQNDQQSTFEVISDQSIEYLILLDENRSNIADQYLQMKAYRFERLFRVTKKKESKETSTASTTDILEYIDYVGNVLFASLEKTIYFYNETFLARTPSSSSLVSTYSAITPEAKSMLEDKLRTFVEAQIKQIFDQISGRIKQERKLPNNMYMFVRALDRFYLRLQRLKKVYFFSDFTEQGSMIVYESSLDQCNYLFQTLVAKYQEELSALRHDIINEISKSNFRGAGRLAVRGATISGEEKSKKPLHSILVAFELAVREDLKAILLKLDPFLDPEFAFLKNEPLRARFINTAIFENVVIKYIKHILETAAEAEHSQTTGPSQLILIFSKLCLDMSNSIITYLFGFTDEILHVTNDRKTAASGLVKQARETAQRLLNVYVLVEGQSISNMIRKSVETRDWLSSVEPRSVRSVMKRVIEDVSLIDYHVGQLYEEGVRVERSSDSSRTFSTFNYSHRGHRAVTNANKSTTWSYSNNSFDTNIISNIHKLFNDKIEIFGKIEFSKLSIISGVIKIGLKTLIECVRQCTFSRFGFQQMQIDSYYLQIHLWRFASDEKIIANLVEEVICSTKRRCLDPVGMERSVIENICDNV